MGKYEKKHDADHIPILSDFFGILLGESHTCDITNKETGETTRGYGTSKNDAEKDARNKLHDNDSCCFITSAYK